ncbi:hypothetical protein Golomagni_05095 [Golovinomyces magnicellulatus]|nr:hypothetical protein Golomagni_05095 [Golovinomyces magnicellulatus]
MAKGTAGGNTPLLTLTATVIPSLFLSIVYFGFFLLLRKSQRRFYAPRSYRGILRMEERTEALPNGWFNWIVPFIKTPDSSAIKSQSIDAYLFLRFLKMTVIIMFTGAFITWPILIPIYAMGDSQKNRPDNQKDPLEMLSISNIYKSGSGKHQSYAIAFVGWIFFSFILFLVTRESIFYLNLRQAFLLSPSCASKISSRTVLFTSVPTEYRDEAKLRQIFGSSAKRVWLTKDSASVDKLVKERDKVALQLEAAEIELIKTANIERRWYNKKHKNQSASTNVETSNPEGNIEAESLSARWVPKNKRPTHRLGLFGLIGQKEDTINWCRDRLNHLIPATLSAQYSYQTEDLKKTGGVFIEFNHLDDTQNAVQTLTHDHAFRKTLRFIGINPEEVIWPSLKISWFQRLIRRLAIISSMVALIFLVSIPVFFLGLLININYIETCKNFKWLQKIPDVIRYTFTGLLPALAIGILMHPIPKIICALARLAGVPSLSQAELFTQQFYFIFEVVQVFFVASMASFVTGVSQLKSEEGEASVLPAKKIPNASKFYISYFIVQGFVIASAVISQATGFILFSLIYKLSAKTPRSLYEKWAYFSPISWGGVLPVYTNMAVIGITFSCIAPLTLGFATIGMLFLYWAYRYHLIFVNDSSTDTKGLIYPRALQQLLTGVYLAEICLIALFSLYKTHGPRILMFIFLIFTIIYHICLNTALKPLLQNLPITLTEREEAINAERIAIESGINRNPDGTISENVADPRAIMKPSLLAKFLAPHIYTNYTKFSKMIPDSGLDLNNLYEASVADEAYLPPSVKSEPPVLWIPKDKIGISAEEIAETGKIIPITDEGATISDENKIHWNLEGSRPPIWRQRVFY